MAAISTNPAPHDMKPSTNRSPIMIEVPPARIPEEPGAVIPHAGICKGGVGHAGTPGEEARPGATASQVDGGARPGMNACTSKRL